MNVLSSGLAVGAGNADGGASPRSTGTERSASGGFEAMLQGKAASQPAATTNNSSNKPATADTTTRETDSSTRETDAAEQADPTTTAAAPADTSDTNATDSSEEAPWPPLGLSAILAAPVEPAAPSTAAVAGGMAAEAKPAPANMTGPVLAPPVAGTTAAPVAAGDSDAVAEALPLPVAAAASDELASTPLDGDAPAPTAFNAILQGQATAETRGPNLDSRIDAPTPTPELGSGDFDDAIGARVSWLAEQKIGHAHIRITPHDMGQVEVKLQLDGNRVHASFSSAHADVRQALESSLPRLREMLGEQGLQLAQADVGQQQTPQQDEHSAGGVGGSGIGGQDSGTDLPPPAPHALRLRGLLDAYA